MFVEKSVSTLFFNTIIQQVTNLLNNNNKIESVEKHTNIVTKD